MLPFIRKKKPAEAGEDCTATTGTGSQHPAAATHSPVAPGVQLLKEVWHIDTKKKKRDMPPPEVPHDIYCVPSKRRVPRRYSNSD